MSNLTSTFSLYEVFRILLPGTYVCLAFFDFFEKWELGFEIFQDTTLNIIVIIIVGLFFYSWDIPKILRKFQKDLPSIKIQERHPEIDKDTILNSYFDFYDELKLEFKIKHEKYSGYFHLSINMILTSITILVVGIISCCYGYYSHFVNLSLLILVLSVITSSNIYYFRLRSSYTRHIEKYYDSDQYKKLIKI